MAESELPRYVSHKKVWALEIASIDGLTIVPVEEGYAPFDVEPEVFVRYTPLPGDFFVVYADGYKSISPRKPFIEGYTRD